MSKAGWLGLVVLMSSLVILHAWHLSKMPRGLYLDETSIGVNALDIAERGVDEHGVRWPVYFEAFGEYKNPIYIYVTAGLLKLVGPSDFTLRLPATLFLGLALLGAAVLAHLLWPKQPALTFYVVAVVGLIPWFWPMSRIAFETISQLPAWIWLLVFTYWAYERPSTRYTWIWAILMGLVAGLSVYTYSTSRLLTFIYLASWAGLYIRRKTITYSVLTCIYFVVTLIPYMVFSQLHPGALTSRFKVITYIYDPTLTLGQKIWVFLQNYGRHFSPDFLVLHGDHNIRHATGWGGELFYIVALLSLLGLTWLLKSHFQPSLRSYGRHGAKWFYFLLGNLLLAPVAAALTTGDTGHSLRTVSEGVLLLIFSGYGVYALSRFRLSRHWIWPVYGVIFTTLLVEAGLYQWHYWVKYPDTTVYAFENYNLRQVLQDVVHIRPAEIVVTDKVPTIHLNWYTATIPGLTTVPIKSVKSIGDLPTANTCFVYYGTETPPHRPAALQINPEQSQFKAQCW